MADLNDYTTWATPELHTPPDFDVKGYQSRINRILGVSASGAPIIRLIWTWGKEGYSNYYSKWDNYGMGTDLELRARYRFVTIPINNVDYIDIPAPRWVLEERIEPAQYLAGDEEARFQIRDGKRVELRPPLSRDGFYAEYHLIADHKKCCKGTEKQGKLRCWGAYRLPNESDLEDIRIAKNKRDNDLDYFQDPHKPFTPETLQAIERQSAEFAEEQEHRKREQQRLFINENAKEFVEHFTGIKSRVNPYSIPKMSPGGIILTK